MYVMSQSSMYKVWYIETGVDLLLSLIWPIFVISSNTTETYDDWVDGVMVWNEEIREHD